MSFGPIEKIYELIVRTENDLTKHFSEKYKGKNEIEVLIFKDGKSKKQKPLRFTVQNYERSFNETLYDEFKNLYEEMKLKTHPYHELESYKLSRMYGVSFRSKIYLSIDEHPNTPIENIVDQNTEIVDALGEAYINALKRVKEHMYVLSDKSGLEIIIKGLEQINNIIGPYSEIYKTIKEIKEKQENMMWDIHF